MVVRLAGDYPQICNGSVAPIDYSAPECHAAYIYTYMPANADLIFSALCKAGAPARSIFAQPSIRIVCVGGGPGTELMGTFKYMDRMRTAVEKIDCIILDHHPNWTDVWPKLSALAPAGISASMSFQPVLLNDPSSIPAPSPVADVDIITFSYSLSEAWRYDGDGSVSASVTKIIDSAREGCLLIYSDNAGDRFDPHMTRTIASRPDVKLLHREDRTHMLVSGDEESSVLADYTTWLGGRKSKLTGRATVATFEKQ